MNNNTNSTEGQLKNLVFDYRALRLMMGLIAISLPFVVSMLASNSLTSISASYYTEARNAFVGMLFVVGAFLFAYNGHTRNQGRFSRLAAIAAILVAVCPTACDLCLSSCTLCNGNNMVYVHYVSAISLFSILAYFCLGPFRVKKENDGRKRQIRLLIYLACGLIMIISIMGAGILTFALNEQSINHYRVIFWSESIALCAFGVAWITAGKYFRLLVDEEEALVLFQQT